MLDTYFSLPTSDYFLRSRCGITELNECTLRLVKYIAKLPSKNIGICNLNVSLGGTCFIIPSPALSIGYFKVFCYLMLFL